MRDMVRAVLACCLAWMLVGPAAAATQGAAAVAASAEVPLVIYNNEAFVFRSSFIGASPQVRAARAKGLIEAALNRGGDLAVSVKPNPEGKLLLIDGSLVFVVTAADVDPLAGETLDQLADRTAQRLRVVISETREALSVRSIIKALILVTVATLIFALLLWVIGRLRTWVSGKLLAHAGHRVETLKIGGTPILEGQIIVPAIRNLFMVVHWLVIALLAYQWLGFVLSRFPYTRPWGERLNGYLLDIVQNLGGGIVGAIPGLGVAVIIFLIARFSIEALRRFLDRLSRSAAPPNWLSPDTMPTTRRLIIIGIWLFAVAMAYPYLPGSDTNAFKGLSVLLGLMVSLGASSIVGQGASGLILTYTRTMKLGEYVRIGEHEGTVTRMGMFTTTIATGLGEELTIPNAMITSGVTKNYSRAVQGPGYVVDTTVTIGYDTPWRQVEAMLKEAARRTPGILETPAPRVFQTGLSDFYPEYRLVAQAVPSGPSPRAEVLSVLHANIQDVFNEYGVQIMSPHYMADTSSAKVVPPDRWFAAPAAKVNGRP